MDRRLFSFDLPPALIAQQAIEPRSAARMLVVQGATAPLRDLQVRDLPGLLAPGDLLVLNDTQVLPARLHGHKSSGGVVEILIERLLDPHRVRAQLRVSKKPAAGTRIHLPGGWQIEVLGRHEPFFDLSSELPWTELLQQVGHMPLPPYIARADTPADHQRYQTVYARVPGAVAAPTAGLHVDADLLAALDARGVHRAQVTLHVGAGTFQPIRTEDVREHRMHSEWIDVPQATVDAVTATRARGGRVIALGTTALRALESAAVTGSLQAYTGDTAIYITPGHRFRVVDGLFTNFHLPESSLLVLVCALMGRERMLAAYQHAIDQGYRFYSYGDASLLLPEPKDGALP